MAEWDAVSAFETSAGAPKPSTVLDLLREVPGLRDYGMRLIHSLWRAGVRCAADIMRLSPEKFVMLRGVGRRQVEQLLQVQSKLSAAAVQVGAAAPQGINGGGAETASERGWERRRGRPGVPYGAVSLSAAMPVEAIVELGLPRASLLLNSLLRAGARTIGDVLSLRAEEFAAVPYVGKTKLEALRALQEELRTRLAQAFQTQPRQVCEVDLPATSNEPGFMKDKIGLAPLGEKPVAPPAATGPPHYSSLAEGLRDLARRAAGRAPASPTAERNADIWLHRSGVLTCPPPTLERVAKTFNLTRQRVRQVYAKQTARMRRLACSDPPWMAVGEAINAILQESLGCVPVNSVARQLALRMGWNEEPTPRQLTALAMLFVGTAYEFEVDEETACVWHVDVCEGLWQAAGRCAQQLLADLDAEEHVEDFAYSLSVALTREVVSTQDRAASSALPRSAAPPTEDENTSTGSKCWGTGSPSERALRCCGARQGAVRLPTEYVRARLLCIEPTPLAGDVVRPVAQTWLSATNNLRRAIFAALVVAGRPLHYTEIARLVREQNPRLRSVTDRRLHACLVRCEEFVLTERLGTYGLAEWGVKPYRTVADRVEELLQRAGRPLHRREIAEALASEGVPYNNVVAALKQGRFRVYLDGSVGLSKWREGPQAPADVPDDGGGLSFSDTEDDWLIVI